MMFWDGLVWKVKRMEEGAKGSFSFAGLLFLLFLGLKLGGIIHWSWWWVTAPLWLPVGLILSILLVIGLVGGLIWYWQHD